MEEKIKPALTCENLMVVLRIFGNIYKNEPVYADAGKGAMRVTGYYIDGTLGIVLELDGEKK